MAGADPVAVMEATTAACLATARLGDLDSPTLRMLGLTHSESVAVLAGALAEVGAPLTSSRGRGEELIARLRPALGRELPAAEPPPFVEALARQPRAGVTCPGRARIMLEPPENHAEHCLVVAVYGVLLAPAYGADPATVFLAGLAHHLHNAAMPDSGFTGEMLLGPHLEPVMAHAATPEGRAFHAADVADRVLQIAQHLKAATLTMDVVLDDMELVHDGPVKGFHDSVLRELGLP
jgi:hypothetical protein